MELSKEAYQLIVKFVSSKTDLCVLARVSKAFRPAAERALYNTIYMRDPATTVTLCNLLATSEQRASYVDAITVFARVNDDDNDKDDEDDSEESEEDVGGDGLPEAYWTSLAAALRRTTRLRFLNLHIESAAQGGWILQGCTFQLRAFHCDLTWDGDLAEFLGNQRNLDDLFIADFASATDPSSAPSPSVSPTPLPSTSTSSPPPAPLPAPPPALDPRSLPSLSTLECSFTEAVLALAPGRPLVRLKTCFSRDRLPEKHAELVALLESLSRSSKPLRALDLADSAYTEDFSLAVLAQISRRLPELRYLGTLVLPVGKERLQFFGMLMRLRKLRTIELEVSDWDPAPTPPALRALASELRLYRPSIACVVFVQDFTRTVVRAMNGICVIDAETNSDNLWREM
ncbi:hypothetical protein BD410DRAFT_774241 [Rickenella mellea]|uniref:F-box domain-containing protein n=1 Tax=Rickenella mellea TaxID=50990 RepID=A0A4Y7PVP7_9AGAM|nr:hypothetical protein BD410DRAFT_774241 [Rickenella mellea]